MRKVIKNNQPIRRVVLDIGDDQFSIDEDREVFKNGYGQVFTKEHLTYSDRGVKKRIPFAELFEMLFIEEKEPKEAYRIMRLKAMIPRSAHERKLRVMNAIKAKRVSVIRSDGSRADSMTKAAKKLGCTTAAISKSIKTGGKVRGYTFQLLTE